MVATGAGCLDVAVSWRPAIVIALVASRAAAADPQPERVRIEYRAPDGCPVEGDVVHRLVARAPVKPVLAGEARVFTLQVTAGEGDAAFRGELVVRDAVATAAPAATREVSGATCDETVAALVLVAALAVEEREAVVVAPPRAPRWGLSVGAGVARYDGMTPSAIYGVPMYLAARRARLQVRATFDATASDELAMTTFRWTAGRLEGCPYVVGAGPLELAPCAGVQIGALSGRGTAVPDAARDTRLWLAPELAARITLRIGRAAVELEGTAAAPLVRDRYYIAPSTTVHEVPALAFAAGASVGLQFF